MTLENVPLSIRVSTFLEKTSVAHGQDLLQLLLDVEQPIWLPT